MCVDALLACVVGTKQCPNGACMPGYTCVLVQPFAFLSNEQHTAKEFTRARGATAQQHSSTAAQHCTRLELLALQMAQGFAVGIALAVKGDNLSVAQGVQNCVRSVRRPCGVRLLPRGVWQATFATAPATATATGHGHVPTSTQDSGDTLITTPLWLEITTPTWAVDISTTTRLRRCCSTVVALTLPHHGKGSAA